MIVHTQFLENIASAERYISMYRELRKQQIIHFSPSLADKVARSTASHTVDEIAREIADLIQSRRDEV